MAHPTLDAIKAEFDKVEKHMIEQLATGRVADWSEYRHIVGRIQECRQGRERTLEILKTTAEADE